jgi:hypothetical protein
VQTHKLTYINIQKLVPAGLEIANTGQINIKMDFDVYMLVQQKLILQKEKICVGRTSATFTFFLSTN